jgi:hypothetical protein
MRKEEQTEFEKKVLDQFMSGKNLFGKGGAFWLFRRDHATDFGQMVPL